MNNILEHFKKIVSVPHCSFDTALLKNEIIDFAKKNEFEVFVDTANNILCKKGNPRICLQSHYDMVCIGDAPKIELVQEDNILKAKNSTLGADNGMGISIMFSMMEKYSDIECLFTNDEEVGLVGASNLELQLSSNKLLNLDGEQEDEVYIGCAGGVDVISTCKVKKVALEDEYKNIYNVSVENLDGGHSGVDIDKGIDSAIKVLINEISKYDIKLLHVEGGEMRNSIAKNAYAQIASKEDIKSSEMLNVEYTQIEKRECIENSDKIIKVLNAFSQGVRGYDKKLMIPTTSINIGKIRIERDVLRIDCSARAMKDKDLETLADETISLFKLADFESAKTDAYPAWTPQAKEFTHMVEKIMRKTYKHLEIKAIHAGLECGILKKTQDKEIEALSIGPTIRFPHSLREECDLDSVQRISDIVENIINNLGE